jgi:hypothetical protein
VVDDVSLLLNIASSPPIEEQIVGVQPGVPVGVGVNVSVGVNVGVGVNVSVGEGEGVGVGVGLVAGDAWACAGKTTSRTTGRTQRSGSASVPNAPPPNAPYNTSLRLIVMSRNTSPNMPSFRVPSRAIMDRLTIVVSI